MPACVAGRERRVAGSGGFPARDLEKESWKGLRHRDRTIAAAGIPEGFHSGLPWWGAARGAEAREHATPTSLGSITFGLGAAMLVGNMILVDHLGAVVRCHISCFGLSNRGGLLY